MDFVHNFVSALLTELGKSTCYALFATVKDSCFFEYFNPVLQQCSLKLTKSRFIEEIEKFRK